MGSDPSWKELGMPGGKGYRRPSGLLLLAGAWLLAIAAAPGASHDAMLNWRAFGNRYWPALYLIDRRGRIRDLHIGELHEGTPAWRSMAGLIERLRRERG